jgi:diacylglycerol kinase family enzyme
VLFLNPRSGGGKATRFNLSEEAWARGIEPVELQPGDNLQTLVRHAVDGGADAVAMAGGDGSQAVVAAVAAEFGLPYACIPAGTRNHFALGLGVDRDDVVGALDAFVDGGERRVDLAEVNGVVFVNNVSFDVESGHPGPAGVDGEAVGLDPPVHFQSRPLALRVRIARQHPGASPSAAHPESAAEALRVIVRLAAGRSPV